jgi:hypothetical protein
VGFFFFENEADVHPKDFWKKMSGYLSPIFFYIPITFPYVPIIMVAEKADVSVFFLYKFIFQSIFNSNTFIKHHTHHH